MFITHKLRLGLCHLVLVHTFRMVGIIWEEIIVYLPGHNVVHANFCTLCPSQKAPPLSGAGLVQVLVRFWYPRPQRLLHTDHSVQVDQPPLTEWDKPQKVVKHVGMNSTQTTHRIQTGVIPQVSIKGTRFQCYRRPQISFQSFVVWLKNINWDIGNYFPWVAHL